MLGKKVLLVSVALIALMGMFAVIAYSDNSAEGAGLTVGVGDGLGDGIGDSGPFDVAAALENAVSGDIVTLPADATLSRDATITAGVTLDDNGFSLTIPSGTVLSVSDGGTFVSTGNLQINSGGSVVVFSGVLSMDGNSVEVAGSLEIYKDGTLNIGQNESSTLDIQGVGKLLVDGTMNVGGTSFSSVIVQTGTITGTLNIAYGSSFNVYDVLTIGSAPSLMTDLNNTAVVTGVGKIFMESQGCIVVYGSSGFGPANIKNSSVVSTVFQANGGDAFATEYKDNTGKRALVMPSTSSLKDWNLVSWNAGGNTITADSNIQIGAYPTITGVWTRTVYNVTFAEDKNIIWRVNGIDKGDSYETTGVYGSSFTVSISLAPGNTSQMPVIYTDGVSSGKTQVTVTVTSNTTFTTSNHYITKSDNTMTILLVVLGVMIVILALLLIFYVMKNRKKDK